MVPKPASLPLNEIPTDALAGHRDALIDAWRATRARTEALAAPLSPEDQMVQSMADASPVKWHLAHTTWFFETFILAEHAGGYECFDEAFRTLFNSYYNGVGEQYPRPKRGMMSRPPLERVQDYRGAVDDGVERLLDTADAGKLAAIAPLLVLGVNHEQQHQELILIDIKHGLWQNPTRPAYADHGAAPPAGDVSAETPGDDPDGTTTDHWWTVPGGDHPIGRAGEGFAFDNERPAHTVRLDAFELARRPVTNAEWLEFIDDGGYDEPLLWLSDGWDWRRREGVETPLYWRRADGDWRHFTLRGDRPVLPGDPVTHVSYYEADAYARWRGARLPTEFEWEAAARQHGLPRSEAGGDPSPYPMDNTWEWTASAYAPYPGFQMADGAVGEYNGKFMVNQMVLRGASGATAPGHSRPSYRNFFYPDARWQFSGVRLARGRMA